MTAIIKREMKNYFRNPLLWLGLIIISAGIYQSVGTWLHLHYFEPDAVFRDLPMEDISDADIADGYIPCTKEQQWDIGCREIERKLIEALHYSPEEAGKVIDGLKEKDMSISELNVYMVENHNFYNADYIMDSAKMHKGTPKEINAYLREKMEENPFSYYFSRKFADFGGLFMGFFAMILLAFLYIRDSRKDMYELLHTKPVSAKAYITGKAAGGFLSMLTVLGILDLIFGILCEICGRKAGLPVRFWDIPAASVLYIVPNLLMITSVYTLVALLFKNPLPAVPLLFLYMVYSNMGRIGPDGSFGYYGRPLAIMVRFPGNFLDTAPPPYVLLNQLFLVIASVIILLLSAAIWRRRRVYR